MIAALFSDLGFEAPEWLAALLLVPVAVAAYVAAQRRRRLHTARFSDFATLASVLPTTPGVRRHVPPALLLVALSVLAVALARPEATVSVPREEASVVLVTDTSGSMMATDVAPNRLDAARRAARTFLDDVPDELRVGLVAFSTTAQVLQRPTTDREAVGDALATLVPEGGTATGDGITAALRALQDPRRPRARRPPSAVVLLSDGKATSGADPVRAARSAGRLKIPVFTVALGTPEGIIEAPGGLGGTQVIPVPPDPESLREVAEASGGRFFDAPDAGDLEEVYERLGSQLGTRKERREVTAAFAGGALVLLLGAAAASLRWFGRLL